MKFHRKPHKSPCRLHLCTYLRIMFRRRRNTGGFFQKVILLKAKPLVFLQLLGPLDGIFAFGISLRGLILRYSVFSAPLSHLNNGIAAEFFCSLGKLICLNDPLNNFVGDGLLAGWLFSITLYKFFPDDAIFATPVNDLYLPSP